MVRKPRRSISPRRVRSGRVPAARKASRFKPAAPIVELPLPAGENNNEPLRSGGVVAIGASAGGLEAFMQLLGALPGDLPLSFVFIQHLSPQHESGLAGVLANRTPMPVLQAADGMPLEPRHIYVIPPNAQMAVRDGRLTLQPRPFDRSQFTPIDIFFQSLARWAQGRAIGVVLSGTASDGAAGIREIKSAGGITIAQRPESARYDGMPRAAIGTGMVDLVLSPEEIAEHLATLDRHPVPGSIRSRRRDDCE